MLGTKRLTLLPMSRRFEEELIALHQDPDVMAFIPGTYSPETTRTKIRQSEEHWLQHGFGLWCLFQKETGIFIGRGGLRFAIFNGKQEIELAYILHKKFWRQGYASELGTYCLGYTFNVLGFDKVCAATAPENIGSQQVMRKIGMTIHEEPGHYGENPPIPVILASRTRPKQPSSP